MQDEFIITFDVGSLMGPFKLYDAQNCSKKFIQKSVFKSPRTIKLSYLEEQK